MDMERATERDIIEDGRIGLRLYIWTDETFTGQLGSSKLPDTSNFAYVSELVNCLEATGIRIVENNARQLSASQLL
jgi:hypothetical protein